MNVREATLDDLGPAVQLLVESYSTTEYSEAIKPHYDSIAGHLIAMMANPFALVLVATKDDGEHVGVVGALAHQMWLNRSHVIAQELFWYVQPDHRKTKAGKRLMAGLEDWANNIGADAIAVAAAVNPQQKRMKNIFIKQGYTETETFFTKEL